MGEASEKNGKFGDTGVIELTGKIMVVAIVLLFFVVVFVFCLHIYTKWFWYRRQENSTTTAAATRRRHRLEFAAAHQEISLVSGFRHGLDPEVLKTIPVIVFDPKEFKDRFVCAVCLCEVSESEKTRLLPKCNHGFHVDCIDMWFQSHSTCPLCRNPVDNLNRSNSVSDPTLVEDSSANIVAIEVPNFPTNVLIWGNETQVSTFGSGAEEGHQDNVDAETSSSSSSVMASTNSRIDGVALIDIPWPICEEDEQKSPIPMRLRSLKRLLSGNRRVNPSSLRNLDLEPGVRGQS